MEKGKINKKIPDNIVPHPNALPYASDLSCTCH